MGKVSAYKGTCHVILLAKLHDMYLYKTVTCPRKCWCSGNASDSRSIGTGFDPH